jgi:hypothetical protein
MKFAPLLLIALIAYLVEAAPTGADLEVRGLGNLFGHCPNGTNY